MRKKNPRGILSLGLALALATGLNLAAHAGDSGEKIQFSSPNGTPSATSSSQGDKKSDAAASRLNPTLNPIKQLQEDLFRPLKQSMQSVDSMEGVTMLPRPPQPTVTKKSREQADKQRNWAFADMNELDSDPKNLEGDATSMDKDRPMVSAIQQFVNGSGIKKDADKNGRQNLQWYRPAGEKSSDLSHEYSWGYRRSDSSWQSSWKNDEGDAKNEKNIPTQTGLEGLRGLGHINSSPAEIEAQKRLDDFKRLLDPSLPPAKLPGSSDYGNPMGGDPYGTLTPVAKISSDPQPFRSPDNFFNHNDANSDPTAAALHSHAFDNPTANALNTSATPSSATRSTIAPPPANSLQSITDPFASIARPRF